MAISGMRIEIERPKCRTVGGGLARGSQIIWLSIGNDSIWTVLIRCDGEIGEVAWHVITQVDVALIKLLGSITVSYQRSLTGISSSSLTLAVMAAPEPASIDKARNLTECILISMSIDKCCTALVLVDRGSWRYDQSTIEARALHLLYTRSSWTRLLWIIWLHLSSTKVNHVCIADRMELSRRTVMCQQ